MKTKNEVIKELKQIPGIGVSLATDLWNIGIKGISDLKNNDPKLLYDRSNQYCGTIQDPCVLYAFRCAVYYASTEKEKQDQELLKWWNWKNRN
jgi:hypothetical protein